MRIIRAVIKEAYSIYPFLDGELWLDMLSDRNSMAHIYDGNAAKELVQRTIDTYIPQFQKLEEEIIRSYGGLLEKM